MVLIIIREIYTVLHGIVHGTARFGHAMFVRYLYMVNVVEYIQTVNTKHVLVNVCGF